VPHAIVRLTRQVRTYAASANPQSIRVWTPKNSRGESACYRCRQGGEFSRTTPGSDGPSERFPRFARPMAPTACWMLARSRDDRSGDLVELGAGRQFSRVNTLGLSLLVPILAGLAKRIGAPNTERLRRNWLTGVAPDAVLGHHAPARPKPGLRRTGVHGRREWCCRGRQRDQPRRDDERLFSFHPAVERPPNTACTRPAHSA
jgi:hypothetical protein